VGALQYDVFISYSHAADDLLSERVQDGLQRFAKPWWRRRELSVFRDRTGLTADPGLWSSIVAAMDASKYFLLLAAPEAAASAWVNREVTHWRELHGSVGLLILQTDGEIAWAEEAKDFDWARTTAMPLALTGCFIEEPRHVDMRWAGNEDQLDLTNGRFRDQIAELSAPIHGVRKDDIAGEHVRQHRRTVRTVVGAGILLSLLTIAAVAAAAFAVRSADQARTSERRAVSEQLAAEHSAALAKQRGEQVAQTNAQLASVNLSLKQSNQQLANTNTALVEQTNQTEQQRQQAVANATTATRNANEARRNADRANQNAAEAATNADRANQNAAEAATNADRANQNAAEAQHNANEAAQQRNAAIKNQKEATLERNIAIANEKQAINSKQEVEQRNAQLAAANAAGLSRQLAAESLIDAGNLDEALLLAVASRDASPTPASHDSLLKLSEASVGVRGFLRPPGITPDSPAVGRLAFTTSADGSRHAEWTLGGDITVWQATHPGSEQPIAHLTPGRDFTVTDMTFSHDDSHLVAWDATTGRIRSWSIAEPNTPIKYQYRCDPGATCSPIVTPAEQLVVPEVDHVSFLDPTTLRGPTPAGRLGADGGGPKGSCATPTWSGEQPLTAEQTETCMSSDGRFVIGTDALGHPLLWDMTRDATQVELTAGSDPLQHTVVAANDTIAAAATTTGQVWLFDPTTGNASSRFLIGSPPVALAIAPNTNTLAVLDASGHLTIHRRSNGSTLVASQVMAAVHARLEYAPNGKWVAVLAESAGNPAAHIQIINTSDGQIAANFTSSPGSTVPLGFAFDRADHALVQTDPNTLLTWNLETDAPASAVTAPHGFGQQILIAPDANTVAALSAGDTLTLLPLNDLTEAARSLPATALVNTIRYGPSGDFIGAEPNGTLIEWNLNVTAIGRSLVPARPGECNTCALFAVSPDGTAVATADQLAGGLVTLQHPLGSQPQLLALPDSGQPTQLTFSAGGTYVVLIDHGSSYLATVATGKPLPTPIPAELSAFSADDSTAASFDPATNTVSLWSLANATRRTEISISTGAHIEHIALDGHANRIAALDAEHNISVWDTATGREIAHWNIANASAALTINQDGTKIAVWAQGGRAWLLNTTDAAPLGNVAADHPALAFNGDGTLLATNVNLFTQTGIKLWDTTTFEPIGNPLPTNLPTNDPSLGTNSDHSGPTATELQFDTDNHSLLALTQQPGSATIEARAITIDPKSLAATACNIAARNLTEQERQRFDPTNKLPPALCPT
jgi:WD40 repeat protein